MQKVGWGNVEEEEGKEEEGNKEGLDGTDWTTSRLGTGGAEHQLKQVKKYTLFKRL